MDETLTEYFKAFYAMCKRVNGRRLTEEEENLPISVDPISEERASRTLARIDLLSKIREEILTHPELDERLQLCQHSMDLPEWWICGKHDKDLLNGAAKYGLNRLDFNLVNDPELSFAELFKQIQENEEKNIESNEPKVETKTENCETPEELTSKPLDLKEEVKTETEVKDKTDVESTETTVKEETENKSEEKTDEKESEVIDDKTVTQTDEKEPQNEEKDNEIKDEVKDSDEKSETPTDEKVEDIKSPEKETESEEKVEQKESEIKDSTNEKNDSEEQKTDTEMEVDSNEKKDEQKETSLPSEEIKETKEKNEIEETSEESEVKTSEPKDKEMEIEDKEPKEETIEEKMECDEEKTETKEEINDKIDENDVKTEVPEEDKKSISTEDSVPKTEETVEKDISEMKTESESASVVTEKEVSITSSSTPQPQSTQMKTFPRFPKDRVLQMRLEQICHTVDKNEWPSLRHSFFSLLTGPHQSTPSVATADSSPRPISPGSISSASREPTPHPTPDHTPRREALSPLPDFFYADNAVVMNESASRRRRRRRRRFEVEAERQKLRNLLSQTIEQSQQSHSQNSSKKQTSLLSGASSQFLPPLFSLPFCNLRSAIRDELMTDEKTASLLLGSTLQSSLAAAAASAQQSAQQNASSKSSSSSKGPPPAHQNSSVRNPPSMGTLDLTGRFKSSPKIATPPAPAHKPAPINPQERVGGGVDVLDLSSAPSKRTRSSSPTKKMASAPEATPPQSGSLPSKKSSRKIGSRIDALALNLQAKKMMEEKKTDPKVDKLEATLSSLEKRQATHFMEELQKHSALLQGKTPPAAHSKSSSSTSSSKLNDSLMGAKSNAHFSALDASKLPPSKATEASTIAEQVAIIRQNLRNLFEDHPEFIAQNPSMASMVAASAANVFNPNMNMNSISSMPANVCLFECLSNLLLIFNLFRL